jgi:PKD repeat protein
MKINELEKIWNKFSDVPINNNDEIEIDFFYWEKGTCRFDIWDWFDEKLPNGIAKWIYV